MFAKLLAVMCIALAGMAKVAAWAETPRGLPTVAARDVPEDADRAALQAAGAVVNEFGLRFYGQRLRQEQGNVFFSPYSIHSALAMTAAGARGQTEAEMIGVLVLPEGPREAVHAINANLGTHITAPGQERQYALHTANRLWGAPDIRFSPDYVGLMERTYSAQLTNLNFAADPEGSRRHINQWVEEQTQERIKDLLPEGSIDGATALVLTNAIFFKGNWANQFEPRLTRDMPFTRADGSQVSVPMMQRTAERMRFFRVQQGQVLFRMLELPYAGEELSMVLLAPDRPGDIGRLEEQLTRQNLEQWSNAIRERHVHVLLPRFRMTSEYVLNDHLSALGMPTAFTGRADFSGMAESERLFISLVVHKAFVEVNEEGTEAAAATGVVMTRTSLALAPEPETFHADRPFLFLIRDNASGTILFMGRVMDPS